MQNVSRGVCIHTWFHVPTPPVVRSKCPSYVGTEGIVLQETQNTLKVICKDHRIKSESPPILVHVI